MSLFGSSSKTYVSSVVYNLAGPEEDRANYLKTTVIGSVLSGASSIGVSIVNSYLAGPAIRLRRFAKWARSAEYADEVGLITGSVFSSSALDIPVLTGYIPTEPDSTIEVQSADIGRADYTYWGDKHIADNFPALINTAYVVDYDSVANLITITFEDTTTESFTPTDYVSTGRYIYAVYFYKYDAPATPDVAFSTLKVYIYRQGSGIAALDSMFSASTSSGTFLPCIPMRLDNKYVSELYPTTLYPLSKKALKRAIDGKYDKIQESVDENESINDIDYAYVVFGSSLNTRENAARLYIYEFFKRLYDEPNQTGSGEYSSWQAHWDAANASWEAWRDWQENGSIGPEPVRIAYPPMPTNNIKIVSSNTSKMNYNVTISWNYMNESSGTGLFRPDVKKGELDFVLGSSDSYQQLNWVKLPDGTWTVSAGGTVTSDSITLFRQITDNTWTAITIQGLKYSNLIYGGKSVDITAKEALEDAEESGFIIPLHEEIYNEMSLVDATQMATACTYMVFNCYQVVKKKWYQTGIFKIVVFIVIVVVSIYTGGTTAGLLGTSASVGVSLGFTGLLAIIVGAVANALAAMILASIIQSQATNLFGEKLGAIVAAIATYVAMSYGASLNTQGMASSFGNMLAADNIMNLASAVGKGYAGYMQASVNETLAKTKELEDAYNKESNAIKNKYEEEFGSGMADLNQFLLTDVFGSFNESFDSFIGRTLMTGSDIAELSLEMLSQFTDVTLDMNLQTL